MPDSLRAAAAALILVTTAMLWATPGAASCGASFCSVNTQWEAQGAWTEPGVRLNLRYEYMDQDQLRSGTDKTGPAGVPDTHDELRTLNRNLVAGLDYTINPNWAVSFSLPFIQRNHDHVHNDTPPERESWELRSIGDLRASVLYQFALGQGTAGLQFGLKLPTGKFKETNDEGELAERSLQPGSGTTDTLLGVYYHTPLEGTATTLFAQALWQRPLDERDGYAPGEQLSVDVGLRYAMTPKASALLQINMQSKGRDDGINAEPDDSGGTYVFLSPGLGYLLTPQLQVYGFVQLPLYQNVNGTQLTADWSAVAGISWRL